MVLFQPHRYTRTRDLFEDFARTLSENDLLLLLDIYSAGESFIAGADGRSLCRAIRSRGANEPIFIEDQTEISRVLEHVMQDGDILLTLGAGNIGAISERLAAQYHSINRELEF